MTTLKDITSKATRSEKYNTNNAWGFGGGSGTVYYLKGGGFLKVGVASRRHMGTNRYYTYTEGRNRIIDTKKLTDSNLDFLLTKATTEAA
jgi:hypothetical protein